MSVPSSLLPQNPTKWTLQQTQIWLKSNNFNKFVETFEQENIDGQALLLLDSKIILELFKEVAPLGDRLKLNKKISDLQNFSQNQVLKNSHSYGTQSTNLQILESPEIDFHCTNPYSNLPGSRLPTSNSHTPARISPADSHHEDQLERLNSLENSLSNLPHSALCQSRDESRNSENSSQFSNPMTNTRIRATSSVEQHSNTLNRNGSNKSNKMSTRANLENQDTNLQDLEFQLSGYAQEGIKVLMASIYCLIGLFVSTLTMVITAERVPDSKNYPPLPDLILDNLPMIPWAFMASEYCLVIEIIIVIGICIFHRYRLIVIRRGLSIAGSIMLLRSLTIVVTSLSVPNNAHKCIPLVLASEHETDDITWKKRFDIAIKTFTAGGLSIAGVETCGDYMFSGHTAILTLLQHVITEYGPKWPWMQALAYILNAFGAFFVLAGHEHYTLDVLMALYITSRMCSHYTQLANTGPIHWRSKNNISFMTFPLFWFFEGNIPGSLPNIYEHPKYIIKRNNYQIKKTLKNLFRIGLEKYKKRSNLSVKRQNPKLTHFDKGDSRSANAINYVKIKGRQKFE